MTKHLLWLALALPLAAADNPTVEIETTFGKITVELYKDAAPNTVTNFLTLAGKGFYDGLSFHRIIKGFMAQGGDPAGNGSGGPTDAEGNRYCIPAEFNDHKHVRGTLSMARTFEPNTGGSQFFLCFKDCGRLDEQYAVFGQMTSGDEVLAKIENDAASGNGAPRAQVKIVKMTVLSGADSLPALTTTKESDTPFIGVDTDLSGQGRGVMVSGTKEGGGAANSGIQGGDMIERIDGKDVKTYQDYAAAIAGMKPGDKRVFTVRRGDEAVDVTVTAEKFPE